MMFAYQYVIGKKTDKICQSSAYFSEDKIQVITNEGECYREILYSDIVGIRREDIVTMAVSLSAYNTKAPHLEAKYQYICLFMGNQNELPSTGLDFYKNFYQKDFFPIVYSQDAWDFLSDRISMVSENINKKTDTWVKIYPIKAQTLWSDIPAILWPITMAQTIPSHGQTAGIWQAAQREVQVLATATIPTDCVPQRS